MGEIYYRVKMKINKACMLLRCWSLFIVVSQEVFSWKGEVNYKYRYLRGVGAAKQDYPIHFQLALSGAKWVGPPSKVG